MALSISTFLSQSIHNATASVMTVTVGGTPHTATLPVGWLRHYLAATGGGGTAHSNPREFGAYFAAILNSAVAGWVVAMTSAGLWKITNTAGTWSIVWDGTGGTDKRARDLAGFTANIGATAANTYATATWNPAGVVLSHARINDTGWQGEPSASASAVMPTGVVNAWWSGYVVWTRTFDLHLHPTLRANQTAMSLDASVAHPDSARMASPATTLVGSLTSPWSIADLLYTSIGIEVGIAFGDFQSHIAASTLVYDLGYLDPATLKKAHWALPVANWSATRSVKGLGFTRYAAGTRA